MCLFGTSAKRLGCRSSESTSCSTPEENEHKPLRGQQRNRRTSCLSAGRNQPDLPAITVRPQGRGWRGWRRRRAAPYRQCPAQPPAPPTTPMSASALTSTSDGPDHKRERPGCFGQVTTMQSTPGRSLKFAPRSVVRTVRLVATAVAAIIRSCAPRLVPVRWTCASSRPWASAVARS